MAVAGTERGCEGVGAGVRAVRGDLFAIAVVIHREVWYTYTLEVPHDITTDTYHT
jgi:hypothetical protein